LYYGDFGGSYVAYNRRESGITLPSILSNERINSIYNADFDSDDIINEEDNCLNIENSDQKDINYNGVGDACEDFDNDGVFNTQDNCPNKVNYNQLDVDKDGIGDACDNDDDRLSEKNKWLFYVIAVIIVALFGFVGYKIFKDK
jgi:hypothetical protein